MPSMPTMDELAHYLARHRLRFVSGFNHPIARSCPMHAHRALELVYHPRGAGRTARPDGAHLDFAPGAVVVYPPGMYHDQHMTSPGEDCCIQLALPGSPPAALREWRCLPAVGDQFARNELVLLSRIHPGGDDAARLVLDLRATALVAHLLLGVAGESPRRACDVLAERARRLVQERYAELGSLDEVAAALDVSPDHLRHVFKARWRISLVRWLAEVRVERAKDLLAHSSLGLAEIARVSAFSTPQYFSACFRRLVGASPAAWRAQRALRGDDAGQQPADEPPRGGPSAGRVPARAR